MVINENSTNQHFNQIISYRLNISNQGIQSVGNNSRTSIETQNKFLNLNAEYNKLKTRYDSIGKKLLKKIEQILHLTNLMNI